MNPTRPRTNSRVPCNSCSGSSSWLIKAWAVHRASRSRPRHTCAFVMRNVVTSNRRHDQLQSRSRSGRRVWRAARQCSLSGDPTGFQRLKERLETEWVDQLGKTKLPIIWNADFLYGPKAADGADSYVLCEIKVSSIPFRTTRWHHSPPSRVRSSSADADVASASQKLTSRGRPGKHSLRE